jgi:hypothetical protein
MRRYHRNETKWSSARVAASEMLKLVVALVKGLEISLPQRMGVVNLVITYKIDGGNLIDFYPSFLSTVMLL